MYFPGADLVARFTGRASGDRDRKISRLVLRLKCLSSRGSWSCPCHPDLLGWGRNTGRRRGELDSSMDSSRARVARGARHVRTRAFSFVRHEHGARWYCTPGSRCRSSRGSWSSGRGSCSDTLTICAESKDCSAVKEPFQKSIPNEMSREDEVRQPEYRSSSER